jgi:formylmethanofuran dehydrogenase subunit E
MELSVTRRRASSRTRVRHAAVAGLLAGAIAACDATPHLPSSSGATSTSTPWLTLEDLERAGHAPVLLVRDTVSSQGPLADQPQRVTLADLVRYHGHPCDGLAVGAAGIAYGLGILFPDGVVDRTDLVAATNPSVCYGDVAAYLTGARARYGTLIVDAQLGDEWVLCRRSSNHCVAVVLNAGVKPPELSPLESRLRGEGCAEPLIEQVQRLQKKFALSVLSSPPGRVFTVRQLAAFPYEVGAGRGDVRKARCDAAPVGASGARR